MSNVRNQTILVKRSKYEYSVSVTPIELADLKAGYYTSIDFNGKCHRLGAFQEPEYKAYAWKRDPDTDKLYRVRCKPYYVLTLK